MRAPLDVNVLIARLDAAHVHHGCRFVSFDARVDRATVVGAGAGHLVVL
ncbi:hypothetical protein [Vandammella animalimorsus]|nr:hypothetical protein [Vandammella animalimorsus]